jgi:hypothetical protein
VCYVGWVVLRLPLLLSVIVLSSACDGTPRDLREWRASDHDQDPGAAVPPTPAADPSAAAAPDSDPQGGEP